MKWELLLTAFAAVTAVALAQCGDGYCGETCSTCPQDCGPCQPFGLVHQCRDPHTFALTFDDGPAAPYVCPPSVLFSALGVATRVAHAP